MIALLYGKNDFAIQEKIQHIIEQFTKQGGSLDEVHSTWVEPEMEIDDTLLQMRNVSLFSTRKLTILYNPTSNPSFMESIEHISTTADDENWVVLVDSSLQARSSMIKSIRDIDGSIVEKYDEIPQAALIEWITTYKPYSNESVVIKPPEARYLVERVGENQQLLAQELKKLITANDRGVITKKDIDLLVDLTPQGSVFAMLDAMLASKPDKAMQLYSDQIAQGATPQQTIGMIVWQLTQLAIVVDKINLPNKELTSTYGVSSYAVSKLRPIAQKLHKKDIAVLVQQVMEADYRSRTTASAEDAVEYIVSFISSYLRDTKIAAELAAIDR